MKVTRRPRARHSAVARRRCVRPLEQSNLLIEADRRDLHTGRLGEPAYPEIIHAHIPLEPLVARDPTLLRSSGNRGATYDRLRQHRVWVLRGRGFDGLSSDYKRRLWAVIAINASMFGVEMGAGVLAGSQALQADALDFLGDTLTYGLSLAVIGLSLRVRATAAVVKGVTLALMGLWVLGSTVWHTLVLGTPRAEVMGLIGFLALAANLTSVLILLKYKDGDANVRSVWLCSRNDAIGNVAVMLAALGVGAAEPAGQT